MSAFIFVHNFFVIVCMWKASNSPQTLQSTPQHSLTAYHSPVFYNFITVHLNFRCEKIYFFNNRCLLFLNPTKYNPHYTKTERTGLLKCHYCFNHSIHHPSLVFYETKYTYYMWVRTFRFTPIFVVYINCKQEVLITLLFQ